jgi:hypothetical protein
MDLRLKFGQKAQKDKEQEQEDNGRSQAHTAKLDNVCRRR